MNVRLGHPGDADGIADVQYRAWTTSYAGAVPADALNQVDPTAAAIRWRDSILNPPSPSHRVLVAENGEAIVGFAATGPSRDDEETTDVGEIYILLVSPEDTGHGVGTELLGGATERLRDDGFRAAIAWLLEADRPMQELFEGAGWAPDEGRRELDMGQPVPEIRLRTGL